MNVPASATAVNSSSRYWQFNDLVGRYSIEAIVARHSTPAAADHVMRVLQYLIGTLYKGGLQDDGSKVEGDMRCALNVLAKTT